MPIQQCIWTRIQTTWKVRSKFNFGKSLISCPNEWKSLEMKTIFSHLVNCETLSTITACCYFSKIFNYICVCVLHQYMLCYLKKRKKKKWKNCFYIMRSPVFTVFKPRSTNFSPHGFRSPNGQGWRFQQSFGDNMLRGAPRLGFNFLSFVRFFCLWTVLLCDIYAKYIFLLDPSYSF